MGLGRACSRWGVDLDACNGVAGAVSDGTEAVRWPDLAVLRVYPTGESARNGTATARCEPGSIPTVGASAYADKAVYERLRSTTPLRWLGTPEDVAGAIAPRLGGRRLHHRAEVHGRRRGSRRVGERGGCRGISPRSRAAFVSAPVARHRRRAAVCGSRAAGAAVLGASASLHPRRSSATRPLGCCSARRARR